MSHPPLKVGNFRNSSLEFMKDIQKLFVGCWQCFVCCLILHCFSNVEVQALSEKTSKEKSLKDLQKAKKTTAKKTCIVSVQIKEFRPFFSLFFPAELKYSKRTCNKNANVQEYRLNLCIHWSFFTSCTQIGSLGTLNSQLKL